MCVVCRLKPTNRKKLSLFSYYVIKWTIPAIHSGGARYMETRDETTRNERTDTLQRTYLLQYFVHRSTFSAFILQQLLDYIILLLLLLCSQCALFTYCPPAPAFYLCE